MRALRTRAYAALHRLSGDVLDDPAILLVICAVCFSGGMVTATAVVVEMVV